MSIGLPQEQTSFTSLEALGKDSRLSLLTQEPLNVETTPTLLDDAITPLPRMFMRNNHDIPLCEPTDWSLTIDGLVRRPLTIDLNDLRRMPTSSYAAVLECSGNGRQRFAKEGQPAEGLQWGNGAVANVEWIGVPVALVLEAAGIKRGALQAECWGAGAEPFARGIELTKLCDDAMLAYAANGELLPHIHGGPVRLVVPGWGGINWVKWITRMTLLSHESDSIYNQQNYVLYDEEGVPYGKVRELAVKSLLTSHNDGATVAAGTHELAGVAWSAAQGVAQVEISCDGGSTWEGADLLHDLGPRSWRRFVYHWQAQPGNHEIMVRATDLRGNTQPLSARYNRKGYLMNAVQRVRITVMA